MVVLAGELIVSTDGSVADLDALCQQVARNTRNPATGKPLGFSIMYVGQGPDGYHSCQP